MPSPDMTVLPAPKNLFLAWLPGRATHAADATGFEAAADAGEADLAALTGDLLGYPVTLTRFEAEIDEGGGPVTEPAFYVTPAR